MGLLIVGFGCCLVCWFACELAATVGLYDVMDLVGVWRVLGTLCLMIWIMGSCCGDCCGCFIAGYCLCLLLLVVCLVVWCVV